MPFLEAGQLTVEYRSAGSGPKTVVLLHGNFASSRWWAALLERPPRGHTLIAPSMRGFGETVGALGQCSVEQLAADLHAFVARLELPRFHLVGHSLGGAVAMQYALQWPEAVRGLGLVAPAPGDGLKNMRTRSDALGRTLRWLDPQWPGSRMTLLTAMSFSRAMGTYRSQMAEALGKMMPTADRARVDFEALLADAMKIDAAAVMGIYESLARWDVRAVLPRLQLPVHVLGGRDNLLITSDTLEALVQLLPRAVLELWPGVGHSPQLERPEAFSQWVARVAARPGLLDGLWESARDQLLRWLGSLRRPAGQRSLPP